MAWVRTVNDKSMPLDPEPAPDGNVWVSGVTEDGHLRVGVGLSHDDVPPGEVTYRSHFVTCPDAKSWRKGKK